MATWRASARPSASSRRTCGLPPAASSDTLLGELKQWSKACTRSLTRLPRCCHAASNASPYSSRGSRPSTLRHSRSTVSTFTRRAPPSRQAACTERTSPLSALDLPNSSRFSTPRSAARVLKASSSGQLGTRIGARKRRAPHLTRGRVQTLEHRLHLLGAGGPVQAGGGGGAAHEPPR